MDMPMWSDCLRVGHDSIDACHRDIMTNLKKLYEAISASHHARAMDVMEELSDACSIHAQLEDDFFSGKDHSFPHETLDDLAWTLRSSLVGRANRDAMLDLIGTIERTLLSDIYADKAEIARRGSSCDWKQGFVPCT